MIGVHPGRPSLLYNLGCNGVGFLPSIHGGRQIARLLSGEQLEPSIFDPRGRIVCRTTNVHWKARRTG